MHLNAPLDAPDRLPLLKPSLRAKLACLIMSMLVMLLIAASLQGLIGSFVSDQRTALLLQSSIQALLVFIFPSWLTAYLFSCRPAAYIGLANSLTWRSAGGVVMLMALITPAMNALVEWNANISLPESLGDLESALRDWEDTAARTTEILLADTSVWGLATGIAIIGLLTGLAEEFFFRGGLQRALTSSGINPHIAVWAVAFIFSAVHFQFFGFIPRLLLGALFGYLYLCSGSLWVPAAAHALNNASVVAVHWLLHRGYLSLSPDLIGVEGDYARIWLVASLVSTVFVVATLFKPLFAPLDGNDCKPYGKD